MAVADLGTLLQLVGVAVEGIALVWAARTIDQRLRQRRWDHAKGKLDLEVEVIAKAVTGDPDGAKRSITRFLNEEVGKVYETFEDITHSPLRLFLLGLAINLVGISLASGWF